MKNLAGKLLAVPLTIALLASSAKGGMSVPGSFSAVVDKDSQQTQKPFPDSKIEGKIELKPFSPTQSLANYPFNAMYYRVGEGESFASIEQKFYGINIGGHIIASWNSEFTEYKDGKLQCNLKEGDIVLIKNVELFYTGRGNTFEGISKELEISVEEFRSKNPWISGEQPIPGSVYYIPKDTSQKESTIDSKTKGEIPLSTNSNNSCGIVCH